MKVLLCLHDAMPVRFKVPEGASMASFERGVRERLALDDAASVAFLCDGGRAAVRAVEDLEEGEQIIVNLDRIGARCQSVRSCKYGPRKITFVLIVGLSF